MTKRDLALFLSFPVTSYAECSSTEIALTRSGTPSPEEAQPPHDPTSSHAACGWDTWRQPE